MNATANHRFESDALQRAFLQRLRIFASGKPAVTRRSTERWAMNMMRILSLFPVTLCVAAIVITGCSKEEPKVPLENISDYRHIALEFTQSLAAREYHKAYAMTSQQYQKETTVEQLRAAFESIVPADWGPMGSIEVGQTMTSWPGKQPSDIGWAYVSIGGDVYSEAVTVVVTSEQGEAKIREVEMGRP